MSTIQQILKDARAAMDKGVEAAKREFASVRSGKASPSMLDTVKVEMYGQFMAMNQCANGLRAGAAPPRRDAVRQGPDQGGREGDPRVEPRPRSRRCRGRSSASRSRP
jgi:hypothetical protein